MVIFIQSEVRILREIFLLLRNRMINVFFPKIPRNHQRATSPPIILTKKEKVNSILKKYLSQSHIGRDHTQLISECTASVKPKVNFIIRLWLEK